jgi:hypothetical protein
MSTHYFYAWRAVPIEVERRPAVSDDYDPDEFDVKVRVRTDSGFTSIILEHVGRRELHRMARRLNAATEQFPLTPDELAQLIEEESETA